MAEKDVSPGILDRLNEAIRQNNANKRAQNRLIVKARNGQATYADAYDYAGYRGKDTAAAIKGILSSDLPNGQMYFNIADKAIRPVLEDADTEVLDFASRTLENINARFGINLKPIMPDQAIIEDKLKGILDLASSAEHWEDVREEVAETAENFLRKCVDDHIQANAEWQYDAGLSAKVVRTAATGACQWCSDVSGTYTYDEVRASGSDVWQRHANCDCVIEYEPAKGNRRVVSNRYYHQNRNSLSPADREKAIERRIAESSEDLDNEITRLRRRVTKR